MATDSDGKLTKFESSVTVVTAELANSLFGGLYGTSEVASKDEYHPLAHGHVHDGEHIDGHASPISLSEPYHVRGVLVHENLGDDAVMKNNVFDSIYQDDVIPEYEEIGGEIRYYLDLRAIRSDFIFREVQDPAGDRDPTLTGTENKLIRQRKQYWDGSACVDIADVWDPALGYDFVVGSESLEDLDSGGIGDHRMQFDISNGSFRAGCADGDEWNEANRGEFSVAFGEGNKAAGNHSNVSGGKEHNIDSGCLHSSIVGGYNNEIKDDSSCSVISGGKWNDIENDSNYCVIAGGESNDIGLSAGSTHSVIGGGLQNKIDNGSTHSVVAGGGGLDLSDNPIGNKIDNASTHSVIGGGSGNEVLDTGGASPTIYSVIGGGSANIIDNGSTHSVISGGITNRIDNTSTNSVVAGGTTNTIDNGSSESTISGGSTNTIDNGSAGSYIGGGDNNTIDSSGLSTLSGGQYNKIDAASSFSTIAGGGGAADASGNYINGASSSFIGGGTNNTITDAGSVIGGGTGNTAEGSNSSVLGGSDNTASGGGSTVGGGENNSAAGDYSVVSGGGGEDPADGNSASSPASFVGGGRSNNAQGSYSVVCGGDNNEVRSDNSVIVGGSNNFIHENSGYSIIAGGGGVGGEGNDINIGYTTTYGGLTAPPTPSPVSGIFGGKMNHVVGGSGSPGYNFIIGGLQNGIGAVEGSVESCYILGGTQNDIIASNPVGSVIRNSMIGVGDTNVLSTQGGSEVDQCAIFSGENNKMEAGQLIGSKILFCTISGGNANEITSAGQTSSIVGGSSNKILSDPIDPFSLDTSLTSAIIGGYENEIQNCWGSIIGGGGAQIDPLGSTIAPYTIDAGSSGNRIVRSNYTSILGGSSNTIDEESHFSSILSGEDNFITNLATWSSVPYGSKNVVKPLTGAPKVSHASAAGLESFSYTFGQASLSSGNFNVLGDTILQTYAPNATPGIYGGNASGETGGSQSFILNAFGHWQYLEGEIGDPAGSPSGGVYHVYFDGDSVGFTPRESSVYSFNLHCVLSFTALGSNAHHFISFDYKGGLSVDHNGGEMHYGAAPITPNYNSSPATISNTGGPADFEVIFTHDLGAPTHEVVVGSGIPRGPMVIWVRNNSNPGTWTASSLSVRAEFVENRLYYRGA
jgi:hypothetical protein